MIAAIMTIGHDRGIGEVGPPWDLDARRGGVARA